MAAAGFVGLTGFAQTVTTQTESKVDPARLQQARSYQASINQAAYEVEGLKVEVEKARLREAEAKARNDARGAADATARIKDLQNRQQIKQMEMSMYQKAGTNLTKPRSIFAPIAAAQDAIGQLELERDQLALRQTKATQAGNPAEANALGQQASGIAAKIAAKQQEIRLLELQIKSGRN
jgi:hypothetical protein